MSPSERPFVCIKGRFSLSITPRGAAGWRALGWWLALFLALSAPFAWFISRAATDRHVGFAAAAYVLVATVWAVSMTLWMKARSEVIDLEALLERKHAHGRRDQRGRNT